MSPEQFEKLIAQSQPHTAFYLEWSYYSTLDFGKTFLPKVRKYDDKAFHFFDGADLMTGVDSVVRNIMRLNKSKYRTTVLFYTYPKGVEAAKKKDRIRVEEFAVVAFVEVSQDDGIEISFRFGKELENFIKGYAREKKISVDTTSLQRKVYSSTIAQFRQHFGGVVSHYNMLSLIGDYIGVDFRKTHDQSALRVTIDEIKVRESKSDKNKEKDFIINFTVHNQPISAYALQVIEDGKLVYEPHTQKIDSQNQQNSGNSSYKVIWNCSGNQIFEEKDSSRKLKFKITVITPDKQTASAVEEIKLKEFIEQNKKTYNSTEFDKNRVVVWLTEDYTPEKELLPGITDTPVVVYAGAKLIRLKPDRESVLTPCLFWWENAYHIQEFPEELLGDTNEVFGETLDKVFLNDVVHTAHRAKQIDKTNNELDVLIETLQQKAQGKYNRERLLASLKRFKHEFRVDLDNKVETLSRLISHARKVYEPEDENGKMFDQILFVPLSQHWFEKYGDDVKERYKSHWKLENGYSALATTSGGGEVFDNGKSTSYLTINEIVTEILYFLSIETKNINMERLNSDEWKWIIELSKQDISKYRKLILFSIDAWYSTDNDSHASGIGLEQVFGLFRIPPLLTVLLHESTQTGYNPYFFGRVDTHTGMPDETMKLWYQVSDYNKPISFDQDTVNRIYLSHIYISVVNLHCVFNLMQ